VTTVHKRVWSIRGCGPLCHLGSVLVEEVDTILYPKQEISAAIHKVHPIAALATPRVQRL